MNNDRGTIVYEVNDRPANGSYKFIIKDDEHNVMLTLTMLTLTNVVMRCCIGCVSYNITLTMLTLRYNVDNIHNVMFITLCLLVIHCGLFVPCLCPFVAFFMPFCGVFYALLWRFLAKSGQKWQKVAKKWQFLAKFWAKSGQFCPEWENY